MKDITTPDINLTKDQVRFGANVLDYGGTGDQVLGYGVTLFGAPHVGIPLAKGGASISTIGSGIQATLDASEGNLTGAIIEATGIGVGKAVDAGIQSIKRLDKGNKTMLNQNVDLKLKGTGTLIQQSIEKGKEKDE